MAELTGEITRLKSELAGLDVQEGRLLDAIAAGLDAGRVKPKLDDVAAKREQVRAKVVACEEGRRTVEKERRDVDVFVKLQEFFAAVRGGSKYMDPYAVLRSMVHRVEVDAGQKRVAVALNVPVAGEFSNHENGESGPEEGETGNVSRENTSLVSLKSDGEADPSRSIEQFRFFLRIAS